MRGCGCGFTRRDVLRAGTFAAAGLVLGGKLGAQQKKRLRIDIHAHLWTDEYLNLTQSYGNTDTGTQRNKGAGMGKEEIEKRFALMEANGVKMQVLSICPQAPSFDNKEHAVNAARKANDLYAEAVSRWPDKFMAFAAVPLPHVDEALKELDRALGQLKMVGATITTFIGNRSIADPAFAPFYEELNRRATVLYIHPSGNGVNSPFISPFHLTWAIGAPIEDTVSIMHLIEAGIPQRYPKIKIVNSHLGGRCFQNHADYKSLLSKLENGKPLTSDELNTLKLLMVGDADYYMKYDDDFDRSESELKTIVEGIRKLQTGALDVDGLMHLRVLCKEACSVARPAAFYLEQKERVGKFEAATRDGIDREAAVLLANIIKNMMNP